MQQRTLNGSAFFQESVVVHDILARIVSGIDSGTQNKMKSTSVTAINVANITTRLREYNRAKYAPSAGEITIEAAKVAETSPYAVDRSSSVVTSAT